MESIEPLPPQFVSSFFSLFLHEGEEVSYLFFPYYIKIYLKKMMCFFLSREKLKLLPP